MHTSTATDGGAADDGATDIDDGSTDGEGDAADGGADSARAPEGGGDAQAPVHSCFTQQRSDSNIGASHRHVHQSGASLNRYVSQK